MVINNLMIFIDTMTNHFCEQNNNNLWSSIQIQTGVRWLTNEQNKMAQFPIIISNVRKMLIR